MIRLGALVPGTNTTVEPEMYKMAPEGVTVHFERLFISRQISSPLEGLEQLTQDAPRAARAFAVIEPKLKVIAFACNSASFHKGAEFENELVQSIEAAAGVPSISTSGAAIQALKELGLNKLCMISPYTDYQHERGREFLVANGFEVVASKGLGVPILEHPELLPETARELAIATCRGVNCDGVYSCCTAFRTIEILEEVERELGKPMVSANQATMWLMLKKAGVKGPISGFGTLLRNL